MLLKKSIYLFQEKQPVTKRKVVINMMDKYAKPVLKQVTAFIRNDGGPLPFFPAANLAQNVGLTQVSSMIQIKDQFNSG